MPPSRLAEPQEQEHRSTAASDSEALEVPPWQAAYTTCPACHRPVRRERLVTHMEILHPEALLQPAGAPEPEARPTPPPPARGLRGLLGRLFHVSRDKGVSPNTPH